MPLGYRVDGFGEQALNAPRVVLYADLAQAKRIYCMSEAESTEAIRAGLTVGRRDMGMGKTVLLVDYARLLDVLCKRPGRLGRPPGRFGP
jgi:hypothetical protein